MKIWILAGVAVVAGLLSGVAATWSETASYGNHFSVFNLALPPVNRSTTVGPDEAPRPIVEVLRRDHNFGVMEQFTTGTHDFVFRNTGNAPLLLRVESTTCKCTMGELGKQELQPGESTKVTMEWEANKFNLQYMQSATIRTNDPEEPLVQLSVSGLVDRRIAIQPDSVVFSRVSVSSPSTAVVHVFTTKRPNFKVLEFEFLEEATKDYFEVSTREITEREQRMNPRSDGGFALVLTTKPGMPTGLFRQTMRLKTNGKPEQIDIPLEGTVISDVSVVGGARFHDKTGIFNLDIVPRKTGIDANLYVLVKGESREDVKVSIGEVDPADIVQVTLKERRVGDKVITIPLQVRIPPHAPAVNRLGSETGKFGKIILETTNPQVKRVTIYLRFAIEN